jgi:hypothetical protein
MILDNADSYLASLLLPILACRTVLDLYLDEMQGVIQSLYGILELVLSVLGGLRDLWYSQGLAELDQVVVIRSLVVTVTGKVKLGNRRGNSHTLTIQWVHVGDPLHVLMHYTTLPQGNVYEYTTMIPSALTPSPSIDNSK